MNRYLPLLLVGLLASVQAQAQAPDSSRWGAVYIGGGAFYGGQGSLYRQDIALITPGSILLAGGLADHDYSDDAYEDATGMFEAGISLYPCRKTGRRGPELRMGFLYGGRSSLGGYFQRTTRTPYDTLTSSQTGQVYYVDSVYRSTYAVNYSAERFGLNASLIWRTKGRWSVYGGVGLAGGLLMNARTKVYRNIYDSVDGPAIGPADGYYGQYRTDGGSESYRNGTGWWMSLYAPIGIDFQIARHSPFWSRAHLFYELRPQLLFQGTPELGTGTSFGVQSVFGVRFTL